MATATLNFPSPIEPFVTLTLTVAEATALYLALPSSNAAPPGDIPLLALNLGYTPDNAIGNTDFDNAAMMLGGIEDQLSRLGVNLDGDALQSDE